MKREQANHANSGPMAPDVATVFDESRAMAACHTVRAQLQAELERARVELERARRGGNIY
jgi:hypothetical protein